MTGGPRPSSAAGPRRRADAERSIAAILDAAIDIVPLNPHVSMEAIAQSAGVSRATLYVHFPTRESLLEAVTERTVAQVIRAVTAQEPARGEADEALARVLAAAWDIIGRFHALVSFNAALPAAELSTRLGPITALLTPLIARGQRSGAFSSEVPASWHLATVVALVHAASAELEAGRLTSADVRVTLTSTVLAALSQGEQHRESGNL